MTGKSEHLYRTGLRSIGVAILILGLGFSLGFLFLAVRATHNTSDFTVFWTAGRADPTHVYDAQGITDLQKWLTGNSTKALRPFAYPPSALLIFEPLAKLKFGWSYLLWGILISSVFLVASLPYLDRRLIPILMLSPPVVYGVWGGQPTILIAGIILASVTMIGQRPELAGVALGLAAALKPQCLLLVPIGLAASRQWRVLAFFLTSGMAAVLLSMSIFGIQLWFDWLDALPRFEHIVDSLDLTRWGVSPAAIAPMLGLSATWDLLFKGTGVIAGVALVWMGWRRDDNSIRSPSLICGTLLVSPYSMPYELAGLMPFAVTALFARRLYDVGFILVFPARLAGLAVPFFAVSLFRKICQSAALGSQRGDDVVGIAARQNHKLTSDQTD